MRNCDSAIVVRQYLDALISGLSELEALRNRVLEAEQRRIGTPRRRRRGSVRRTAKVRGRR
jgi:hypothetical protein